MYTHSQTHTLYICKYKYIYTYIHIYQDGSLLLLKENTTKWQSWEYLGQTSTYLSCAHVSYFVLSVWLLFKLKRKQDSREETVRKAQPYKCIRLLGFGSGWVLGSCLICLPLICQRTFQTRTAPWSRLLCSQCLRRCRHCTAMECSGCETDVKFTMCHCSSAKYTVAVVSTLRDQLLNANLKQNDFLMSLSLYYFKNTGRSSYCLLPGERPTNASKHPR